MKHLKATILFFSICYCSFSFAQTFPFIEGFTGIPSNTLPAGWSGDMKVLTYHGLNDDKALASNVSSVNITDTAVTPWVGPMATSTEIIFWYRMVDEDIYPSTEKHFTSTEQFKMQISTDAINYTDVFLEDSSNHFATLNFKKATFYLTNYGGQNVKFRFVTTYATGSSYFIDIDSIKIRQGVNPNGINEVGNSSFSLFPNPANEICNLQLAISNLIPAYHLLVYDVNGKEMVDATLKTANYQLSTINWHAGLYFVQLQTSEGILTKKLIVTHP